MPLKNWGRYLGHLKFTGRVKLHQKKVLGDRPSTDYRLEAIFSFAAPQADPDDCWSQPDGHGAVVEYCNLSGVGAV